MKGVSVTKLRELLATVLAKADALLTSEPARMIGYGAAVVVFFTVKLLSDRGYIWTGPLTFEQSVGYAFAALAVTVSVIESIRRFVYSPQTFIEQLADEWANGHDEAHLEEMLHAHFQSVLDQQNQSKTAASGGDTTLEVKLGGGISIQPTDKVQ